MTSDHGIQEQRWRTLIGGFTADEIAGFFGLSPAAASQALNALSTSGTLLELPDGRWRFVPPSASPAASVSSPTYVIDGLLAFLAAAHLLGTSP